MFTNKKNRLFELPMFVDELK